MVKAAPPLKPSVLTLTGDEIEQIDGLIAQGLLPPDWFDRCDEACTNNVFGFDHKKDRKGVPIEQGIGSEQNVTTNHISAYEKWGKDEPDYERHLARLRKLFAEQQPKREAERLAAREAERQKRKARAR
jgi:hypothetical protein